jgi:hypothetical protein
MGLLLYVRQVTQSLVQLECGAQCGLMGEQAPGVGDVDVRLRMELVWHPSHRVGVVVD